MERVSYREYLLWMASFELEERRKLQPSTSDWYVMQSTLHIRAIYDLLASIRRSRPYMLDEFVLKPVEDKPAAPAMDMETAIAVSKAKWSGLINLARKRKDNGRRDRN